MHAQIALSPTADESTAVDRRAAASVSAAPWRTELHRSRAVSLRAQADAAGRHPTDVLGYTYAPSGTVLHFALRLHII